MNVGARTLFAMSIALAALSACVFGTSNDAEAEAPKEKSVAKDQTQAARVGARWQDDMLTRLAASPHSDAWGLFSEGGWSDSGQVIVLASKDRKKAQLIAIKANRAEVELERPLTALEWEKLAPLLQKSTALEDLDYPMLDGLTFEFVHAQREGNAKPAVVDRLFIRDPGNKPRPDHEALIEALQALRPKRGG